MTKEEQYKLCEKCVFGYKPESESHPLCTNNEVMKIVKINIHNHCNICCGFKNKEVL